MTPNNETLIHFNGVSKHFKIRSGFRMKKLEVLKDIDLKVKRGQFFGLIGKNGGGKSTLLRLIMGALQPNSGAISVKGIPLKLIPGMGFDPNLTGTENARLNGVFNGKTLVEMKALVPAILEFAELKDFADMKLKHYSNGMRSRLAFSSAIHAEPDILIMDEFFGAGGDKDFKKKAELEFEDFLSKNKTIIHVSHNMSTIKKYCDEVMVLDKGKVTFLGQPGDAVDYYQNQ